MLQNCDFIRFFFLDLKIYRKIKERERQQRKEEIKTKIINKQQALLKEAYRHCNTASYSSNNVIPCESSNSFDNESVVKVRIRYIPKEENVQKQKHSKVTSKVTKSDEKLSKTKYDEDIIRVAESDRIYCEQNYFNIKSYPIIRGSKCESKQNDSKCLTKNSHLAERCKQSLRIEERMKPTLVHEHPASAPVLSNHINRSESKSITSDPTGNVRAQSTLSARSSIYSGHKSCKL